MVFPWVANETASSVSRLEWAAGLAKIESLWATLGFLLAVTPARARVPRRSPTVGYGKIRRRIDFQLRSHRHI